MRFFVFRINTIEFKATMQIEAQELRTARKKLDFLVKEPKYWRVENETTIMSIKCAALRREQE